VGQPHTDRQLRRVLVIGPGGSGKSWLARRIGDITGLPVLHLDVFYWRTESSSS
jgi:adenylate kinase family enzyme